MSRGRGAPLANLGPDSFAYAILIFWLGCWYKLVHLHRGTYGTYGTVLYQYSLDLFYPGI